MLKFQKIKGEIEIVAEVEDDVMIEEKKIPEVKAIDAQAVQETEAGEEVMIAHQDQDDLISILISKILVLQDQDVADDNKPSC